MTQASVLRRLWQPPARFEDRPRDRRVTFLELFFDLVFVVVIAELAHRLSEHVSWSGVGWFVFLFYAVWSSWINGIAALVTHRRQRHGCRLPTPPAEIRILDQLTD